MPRFRVRCQLFKLPVPNGPLISDHCSLRAYCTIKMTVVSSDGFEHMASGTVPGPVPLEAFLYLVTSSNYCQMKFTVQVAV